MDFASLLEIIGNEPVFESALLLAGDVKPAAVRLQLSRWVADGKIYQLRRGLYALAPPYNKIKPHPFLIANRLKGASYVSCQSALAHYGMIPETTPVTVSVTSSRQARWQTPLGDFEFHHVRQALLTGYRLLDLGGGQGAFVASPEKALLDLIYLQAGGDSQAHLQELRLQNLERLDPAKLEQQAEHFGSVKIRRAVDRLIKLARTEAVEYETL